MYRGDAILVGAVPVRTRVDIVLDLHHNLAIVPRVAVILHRAQSSER